MEDFTHDRIANACRQWQLDDRLNLARIVLGAESSRARCAGDLHRADIFASVRDFLARPFMPWPDLSIEANVERILGQYETWDGIWAEAALVVRRTAHFRNLAQWRKYKRAIRRQASGLEPVAL